MRIRKRQVPLPLSSLLPVPFSDLYLSRSQATNDGGVGGGDDGCRGGAPPPSDLSDGLIRRWGCGFSDHGAHDDDDDEKEKKKKNLKEEDETLGDKRFEGGEEEESEEVVSKNVDLLGPESALGNFSLSPSQEGQKVVPLKKRRGNNSEEDDNKGAKANVEEKARKCVGEIKKSGGNMGAMASSKGRKKARGGALAEGSRCSRVNGRGWRCCQQTLVGYSLCEHHLGKGRLRSMSASAKNKHCKNKETTRQSNTTTTTTTNSEEEEESGKEEKGKKKGKLGMVKARSISSLLGQTSTTEIVAPTDHYGDGDK